MDTGPFKPSALISAVAAPAILTSTVSVTVPPGEVQVAVKIVLVVRLPLDFPVLSAIPVQPPGVMVQSVVFTETHTRVTGVL
jgi:hypothetical protein